MTGCARMAGVPVLAAFLVAIFACVEVPMTGRKQLLLTTESEEASLGADAFKEVLAKETVTRNVSHAALVTRVGQRIAAVTGKNYAWDFKVIDSKTENAFCLPGGKVAFYEGILPACETEAGVAVVMGHEVAHATARHGGERMSQGILAGGLTMALGEVLKAKGVSPTRTNIAMGAFGLGALTRGASALQPQA